MFSVHAKAKSDCFQLTPAKFRSSIYFAKLEVLKFWFKLLLLSLWFPGQFLWSAVMNGTGLRDDVVSTVTDRSILSDEMASLCAKLPIYRIKKTTT